MTEVWLTIGVLCVGTAAIKSAGPLALGGRQPSARTFAVVSLFAPALLAALVVYETLTDGHDGLTVDARVIGVAAAGVALLARAPIAVVVLGAAATTAVTRALGA
jgi:hypothetical protein